MTDSVQFAGKSNKGRVMIDPETYVISCPDPDKIIGALDALMPQLQPDVCRRLRDVQREYYLAYGKAGLHERTNARTIAKVLAEFTGQEPNVIRSGEVGGMRFSLYRAPTPRDAGRDGAERGSDA
jgi:hypothetical protein